MQSQYFIIVVKGILNGFKQASEIARSSIYYRSLARSSGLVIYEAMLPAMAELYMTVVNDGQQTR